MERRPCQSAGVAQLVEQLIRNQQVRGSSPRAGSNFLHNFVDLPLPRLNHLRQMASYREEIAWASTRCLFDDEP